MLIGANLKKDPKILNAAYNDKAGINAAFNLNLLARINRELGGDFDLDRFAHVAFYNEAQGRVELLRFSEPRPARFMPKAVVLPGCIPPSTSVFVR